jgi:RNA polymerase sigma-70 factor (sigma-E family)
MDDQAVRHADRAEGTPTAGSDLDFLARLSTGLPRIQRIARLLTGDEFAAEDLVAEAIARSLPRWRSGQVADASSYVRAVVVHLASARWRRRALSGRRDHFALSWLATADDHAQVLSERDRTLRALMKLPMRRRAVVVLRFYGDLTEQQIADELGISVGTVKSQLSRALEQLRVDLDTLEGT